MYLASYTHAWTKGRTSAEDFQIQKKKKKELIILMLGV